MNKIIAHGSMYVNQFNASSQKHVVYVNSENEEENVCKETKVSSINNISVSCANV